MGRILKVMSRFKVFNPADYKMVNGKVVPKFQPGGPYNPKGITATGDEYDRSGNPGEDFAIENAYSGTKEEIEKWAAEQGYPGYGSASASGVKDFEEVQVTDASGNPYVTAKGNYVYDVSLGGGKYQRVYKTSSGEVIGSEIGIKDANNSDPKAQFSPEVQYKYYKDSKGAPYSIVIDKNNNAKGYGPSYGGYDYKKEGWEGDRTKHLSRYEELLNNPDNNDMVDAMYNEYKEIAQQQGQTALDKEAFKKVLVRGQRHNALVRDVYGDEFALGEMWDKGTGAGYNKGDAGYKSQVYRNTMEALGETPMSDDESLQFQMAFLAAYDQANQPDFQDRFRKAGFDTQAIGDASSINDLRGGKLSKLDSWYGNTTAGYFFGMSDPPEEEKKKEDPTKPEEVYYCVEDDSGSRVMGPFTPSDPAPPGATSGPSNKETADKICNVKAQELEPSAPAPDTWFGNDVRNYITGLGQKMFKGRPGLFQVDPAPYGYALESPDTLIAATTGMSNQYNTMLQNTMAGPAAAAASLGAQGTFLNQLSQDIAGVQNRNVDRLNQAYGQRAQIDQNVNALNTQARKQFLDESNIYGQERVNAMNKRAAMITNLYNRGEENRFNDEMLRYMYPQATYPNRLNMGRTWDWSGQGKNPFLPDTSGSSGTTTADLNSGAFDAYNSAYEQHLGQYGDEEAARKYAENVQKEYYTRNRNASKQNQGYAQARVRQNQSVTGKTGGSMKFGANFTTPWGY